MTTRPLLSRGDFVSGLALAALGAFVAVQASQWPTMGPDGPGAGFFPLCYGIAMSVLALVLVVRSARDGGASGATDLRGVGRAIAAWAALVVAIALLKLIGFAASFALLAWFVIAAMFRRPPIAAAIIAIALAAGFYLLFDVALGVSLPAPAFLH